MVTSSATLCSWLLDCLFPIQCLGGCGHYNQWLCASCAHTTLSPQCYRGHTLGNPAIRSITALGDYHQPVLRRSIHGFKYSGWRGVGTTLGHYLRESCLAEQYDYVIPVPLHQRRLRERGFHHTAVLAACFELPIVPAVRKIQATKPQMELDREQRLTNLHNALVIDDQYREALRSARCLLIDDVYSTGTTLRLCAEQLLSAGCAYVDAAVLAMNLHSSI